MRPSLDSVTTINTDGSRRFLHPADTRGRWTIGRRSVAWALMALYVLMPWMPIGGYPAVFLDVAGRRFHLFGWTLALQESWLLFFVVSGFGFGLILVTALLGRVWCGWACPQTVFLEHLYRRLERWIEGDAFARRRLDAAPWEGAKVAKRGVKHVLFLLLSAALMHVFLAYFVSLPRVYAMVTHRPTDHWGAFLFVLAATGALYFNFAWFREQLCIVLCPYGRLQSALIDDHSLVIGYDGRRGEPRRRVKGETGNAARLSESAGGPTAGAGALAPGRSESIGDCIDCGRCVQVCPTGIDIRQGLQMECIGCTACIDACDAVMLKIRKPRGLIRYDSLAAFAGGRTRWLRPRTILYAALLLVGAAVTAFALSTVRPSAFVPSRMPGGAYFLNAEGIRNQFLVRLTNKTNAPRRFRLAVTGAPEGVASVGVDDVIEVAPMEETVQTVIVRMPRKTYTGRFRFELLARDETGGYSLARAMEFLGPDPKLLDEDYWNEKPSR